MDFPAALYLDKCEADGGLKVYVKATVMENGQRFASYDTVDFQRPSLFVEVNIGFDLLSLLTEELGTMRFNSNYNVKDIGSKNNDTFRESLHLDEIQPSVFLI